VLGRLALGELVEGAVAQLLPGQLTQDRRRAAPVQPRFDGGGPLSGREGMVEGLQAGADVAGLAAQQLTQPAPDSAAGAPAGADPPGLPAAGAGAPEPGIGAGAGRAERLGPGAAADLAGLSASRAAGPALFAGFAPRLASHLGYMARRVAAADRAGHSLYRRAGRAQRPVRGADADRAAPAAPGAGFLVGRVGDQAVRAQRPAVLVTDSDLLDGPAPCARLEAGPGDAVAARPLPADPPVQADDATASGTRRPDDTAGAGIAELADQPQHGRDRCQGARSGQQPGLVLQCPGELTALPGPGSRRRHRGGHERGRQRGIDGCHDFHHDLGRVLAATGRALRAPWLPVPVARSHPARLVARGAGQADWAADAAVPVLSAALQGAQVLPAFGAGRRRDRPGTRLAQRDQQIPGSPRRRRPAIDEDRRPLLERLGELAPLGPAAGDARHGFPDHRPAELRLDPGYQPDHDADRVGEHLGVSLRSLVTRRPW
jgi:hypothetical protein